MYYHNLQLLLLAALLYPHFIYLPHIVPYAYEESLLCISIHSSEIRGLCSIMQCSLRNARKFAIYFVRIFPEVWQILKHISLEYFIKRKPLISEEYLYTLYHYYIYVNVMILLSLLRLYYHYIWLTRLVMNVYYVGISFPMWFFLTRILHGWLQIEEEKS